MRKPSRLCSRSHRAAPAGTVGQEPTSLPDRQTLLSDAQALAENFNAVGNQLSSNVVALNGQMTAAVGTINSLTQQIAVLNNQIAAQSVAGNGGPSNALLDNRDNLVQQLGQEVGVSIVPRPNNTVDVYASGALLVGGSSSANLAVTSGGYGGGISIVYQPTGQDITSSLSGGTIGGLQSSLTQIVSAQNSIGGIAAALASAMNTQQSLGLDLQGALGQNMFTVGGPQVVPNQANTGGGTLGVTIGNPAAFQPANYTVTKTATGYQATDLATQMVTSLGAGPTLSLDGMTLAVSGTINVGDTFTVEPTANAARTFALTITDPSAVAAALPYIATPATNLGNVTAGSFSAAASGSLPAGTAIVPSSYFGQNLTVSFTSATSFNVLSSGGAVVASGSFSATGGAQIAVAYPSPAPSGEVATMALSGGTPAVGDSFALTPGGRGSNGNIVAMSNLAGQNLLSGQTLGSAYASLVSLVGSAGQAANFAAATTQGVYNQVQTIQQSISGVNLDEQAANLVNYQQAYQASAQVIASAQTLFQSLLTAVQAG
jgi:flagellar hook-associated protein 1